MAGKIRVKFVRTELYESEGRNKGPTFEEGSVHDFEPAFAERWIRRGAAVQVDHRSHLTEKSVEEPKPDQEDYPKPQVGADAPPAAEVTEHPETEAEAPAESEAQPEVAERQTLSPRRGRR